MTESLITSSSIKLFGMLVEDIALVRSGIDVVASGRRGNNRFLIEQLADPTSKLARIYGFTYKGVYYELPTASIFLVHGDGVHAAPRSKREGITSDFKQEETLATGPGELHQTGVASKG